jgi:Zinc knuckle
MTEEYWQNNRNQIKQISNNKGELSLFQNMTGRCYHCNKFGHRANECPVKNRKENGNKRSNSCFQGFQGKCGSCGLQGHLGKDCWTREENKDKRPENWQRPKQEKAAVSIEKQKSVEFRWSVEDLKTALTDPRIWIADTGATVHTTLNKTLAKHWSNNQDDTVVVMGNGQKEEFSKIGTVFGTAINKMGDSQGQISLTDVMYLLTGKYNLVSVTKVMQKGWKLEGNNDSLILSCNGKKLTFNIKLQTSQ